MPTAPTVSVVIPLYDKRATIGRAIRSVLAQTESGLDIVVVDDGSTDGSAEIVREVADPRLRVVRQENAGPGAARNRGARETASPLLAFLDADDEWRPDFLAQGVKMLGEHPDAGAYVCGYDAGAFRAERPNKLVALGKEHGCSVLDPGLPGARLKAHVDAMHSSCTIVRRPLFDELGGYYSRDRCRYGEDSFLWLGVLLAGAVCWDPREHVRFHVEDSALGFAQTHRRAARPISLFPETLRERTPPEMRGTLDRVIGEFVAMDLRNLVRSGRLQAAHQLRSKHGMKGVRYSLYDSLRCAKYKINHMLKRNYA